MVAYFQRKEREEMTGKPMTVDELKAWKGSSVSPVQASGVLGCTPYSLNTSAKAGRLGLKHFFAGRNLRISKDDLLSFLGEKC